MVGGSEIPTPYFERRETGDSFSAFLKLQEYMERIPVYMGPILSQIRGSDERLYCFSYYYSI